jgi:hypothetical protein
MANDCSTTINIHSSKVTDTELHNLVWDGFTFEGKKYECPFRYESDRQDPRSTFGITRRALDPDYTKGLLGYLQEKDKDIILFVENSEEGMDFAQLAVYRVDEKFYHDISWNDEYAKKGIDIDDEDWCEKFEDEIYEVQDEIFERFDKIKANYIKKIAA